MSASTYPSKSVTLIDLPEPSNVSAKFSYNFYTTDELSGGESGSDSFTVSSNYSGARTFSSTLLDTDADFVDLSLATNTSNDDYPRTVTVTWDRGQSVWNTEKGRLGVTPMLDEDSSEYEYLLDILQNIDISKEIENGNVFYEESITNAVFSGVLLQPTSLSTSLYSYLSGSFEAVAALATDTIVETSLGSRQDHARNFISQLSTTGLTDSTKGILLRALSNTQAEGYYTAEDAERERIIYGPLARIENNVSFGASYNSLFIGDIFARASEMGANIFYGQNKALYTRTQNVQESMIQDADPGLIRIDDYYPVAGEDFNPLYVTPFTPPATPSEGAAHFGYIVEKRQANPDGTVTDHPSIIVKGNDITAVIDTDILYGREYQYRVRSLYVAQFQGVNITDDDSEDYYCFAGVIVASRPSPWSLIRAVDRTPPPPPGDIQFDKEVDGLTIFWTFPVNTQVDIVKFQIFRRESTDENGWKSLPFTLMGQINFHEVPEANVTFENIPESLIETVSGSKCFFLDTEWNVDRKFIYALCSVDAHGMISNYSVQYAVSYDYFRRGLVVEEVSPSGAPRPYPNLFLRGDTFQDTIKDSGHRSMKIFFDPEYLSVTSEAGSKVSYGLINYDKTATYNQRSQINEDDIANYVINIINIDLQDSKVFRIHITDSDRLIDAATADY